MPAPSKKQKAAREASDKYYHSHGYNFACPACNCKTQINQWNRHAKTVKHKRNMALFKEDNPDFRESAFIFKLNNLRILLSAGDEKTLGKEIAYVLSTDPETYVITDLVNTLKSISIKTTQSEASSYYY